MNGFETPVVVPETQKARGIKALYDFKSPLDIQPPPKVFLIKHESHVAQYLERFNLPAFARPCPTTPKHGFVDSRWVSTAEQLRALYEETRAVEAGAELLVHPGKLNVQHNVILKGIGGVAIGPGNDGATGGFNSRYLATVAVNPNLLTYFLARGVYKSNEDLYFEILHSREENNWHKGTFHDSCRLVQARSGPIAEGSGNRYIPKPVKVKQVVAPILDDLLAWEKKAKELKGQDGVVVWHPGGTLACHAAVHCVANEIPYVTDVDAPGIGQTLEPNTKNIKHSRAEFRAGLFRARHYILPITGEWQTEWRKPFMATAAVLHNAAALQNTPEYARLMGFAAGMMVRLGAILCFGEMRYKKVHGPNNGRTEEYSRWRMHDYAHLFSKLDPNDFLRNFSGGAYGGLPWAECADATNNMFMEIKELASGKAVLESKDFGSLLQVFNQIVNLAHNGGWWFNKFADKYSFDQAAKYPAFTMARYAPVLYDVLVKAKANMPNTALDAEPTRLDPDLVEEWVTAKQHDEDDEIEEDEDPECPDPDCSCHEVAKKAIFGAKHVKKVKLNSIKFQMRPLKEGQSTEVRYQMFYGKGDGQWVEGSLVLSRAQYNTVVENYEAHKKMGTMHSSCAGTPAQYVMWGTGGLSLKYKGDNAWTITVNLEPIDFTCYWPGIEVVK